MYTKCTIQCIVYKKDIFKLLKCSEKDLNFRLPLAPQIYLTR